MLFPDRRDEIISFLDVIFPPKCICCSAILNAGSEISLCKACAEEIDYYNNCINPLDMPEGISTYCDGMICVGKYSEALKNVLRSFKFGSKPQYFRAFGMLLALKVQNTCIHEESNLILPVPMFKSKLKHRGYNQADLMAGYAARVLGIKTRSNLLIKTADTKSQSSLTREERLKNLDGHFTVVDTKAVEGKRILLVDDIITTGSTINECSKALKQAGADIIIAAVIATTRKSNGNGF